MRFSLQDMVRRTIAEAEMREKYAQAEGEICPECKNAKSECTCPPKKDSEKLDSSGNGAPERNEESFEEKTSSAFVEKLASAVAYCNAHFIKVAVGEPEPSPIATPKTTTVGPGIGATSTPNTIDSPTTGTQSTNTGQAKNDQPPMVPGDDVNSPGQTNPDTALETDYDDVPGGDEDWSEDWPDKQASVRDKFRRAREMLSGSKVKRIKNEIALSKQTGMGVPSSVASGQQKDLSSEARKTLLSRIGVGVGAAGAGAGAGFGGKALYDRSKKKQAQVERIFSILKQAEDAIDPASIKASHNDVPPPATQAEEGVPSQPGEVSKQESMINSNDSAQNYTKQQAKAVPSAWMGEVLTEPAQKKSTDPVLHENLDAASGAGVKLSSVEKSAAARSLLRKIAEEGAKDDASPEEKDRAQKLQELLKAKQQEKDACGGIKQGSSMPFSGGY